MVLLGAMHKLGLGVPSNPQAAMQWFTKAADKGDGLGMYNVGVMHQQGSGVPRDYAAARSWFEKAAASGEPIAMTGLGKMYFEGGPGLAPDYKFARQWFDQAISRGDKTAAVHLQKLEIKEAEKDKRYADALRLQELYTATVEQTEAKQNGKPAIETARALIGTAWYSILTRDFQKALNATDRADEISPSYIGVKINRAHALMFLDRTEEARAIYRSNAGKTLTEDDDIPWNRVIVEDFADLRKAGLTHPLMAEIEQSFTAGTEPPATPPPIPSPPPSPAEQ
jgi:TPR repeat protein